jgi:hypothetical protein
MRSLFRIDADITGNLPPLPGVYPDYAAPIVRNAALPNGALRIVARGTKTDSGEAEPAGR